MKTEQLGKITCKKQESFRGHMLEAVTCRRKRYVQTQC